MSRYERDLARQRWSWLTNAPLTLGLSIALGVGIGLAIKYAWPAPAGQYLTPGDQWLGEPATVPAVLVEPELKQLPIKVKSGCLWGKPGSNPWRGDNYSALRAMFLNPADAREGARMIAAGEKIGRVHRSNVQMVSSTHVMFAPSSAQAFGQDIVCLGTTTNFRSNGAEESGDLYKVGKQYLAVWDACRNLDAIFPVDEAVAAAHPILPGGLGAAPEVTQPGVARERERAAQLLYPLVRARPPLLGVPLPGRGVPDSNLVTTPTNDVPEPGTLALLFGGAGVGLFLTRRTHRRHHRA